MSKIYQILLCDDDGDEVIFFDSAFKKLNINAQLQWFERGQDLIDHLKRTSSLPDLIFLDLNIPIKNGLECLSEIKSYDQFRSIPVVIHSTSNQTRDIETAYSKGASLYVNKMYTDTALQNTLQSIFRMDRRQLLNPEKAAFFKTSAEA